MKPKKALLVIDMQKEGIVIPYPSSTKLAHHRQLISNIKRLIRGFTETGNLAIQTKVWITDPRKTTMTKVYPSEGIAGTPGAEIIDELKKEHFSYVVKKTHYSGFWNTNLDAILKKHNVKEVYLTGINTGFWCSAQGSMPSIAATTHSSSKMQQ
jgi:nicotinamidase/pyrazinamidase